MDEDRTVKKVLGRKLVLVPPNKPRSNILLSNTCLTFFPSKGHRPEVQAPISQFKEINNYVKFYE